VFVLVLVAAVVGLPTAATGAPSDATAPARIAANETTYQDSTGEDPAAPDITTIVVSNNDAGAISFRINVPNRPAFTPDMYIVLFVNSDNNASTGDPDLAGSDYVIEVFRGDAALFRWDGTTFSRRPGDPPFTSLLFTYQGGITITINRSELGNTNRLGFVAAVDSGVIFDDTTGAIDFTNSKTDVAPAAGSGLYSYEVRLARPSLLVRRVTTSPALPRAGQPFTVRLVAARSDTGAALQNGRVTCVGRAGTTRLRAQVARVTGGAAVCTWRIPENAKGKQFRGSVAVAFEGLRATRSISRRIA
jgi:hypothetical protein